jgi:hypothetical protein
LLGKRTDEIRNPAIMDLHGPKLISGVNRPRVDLDVPIGKSAGNLVTTGVAPPDWVWPLLLELAVKRKLVVVAICCAADV